MYSFLYNIRRVVSWVIKRITQNPLVHFKLITLCLCCAVLSVSTPVAYASFLDENNIIYSGQKANTACVDPSSTSVSGPISISVPHDFSLGDDNSLRPVNLLKQLMTDFNFKDFQAAGIVGNFMHESGGEHLPPDINEGGGKGSPKFSGGYGWAQWTGGRQVDFIDYSIENGYMQSKNTHATDAANYAWLTYELTKTAESAAVPAVKATNNVSEAAAKFEEVFERAGVVANASRDEKARRALEAYQNGTGVKNVTGNTNLATEESCSTTPATSSDSAIFDEVAFPLKGSRSVVTNPGMFRNNTSDRGAHPYIAYDILTPSGTEVVAFASGKVTYTSSDRCGGKFLTIWNDQAGLGVTYMHLSDHITNGTEVKAGDHVGTVGSAAAGCGTAHLHIDASTDKVRQACSRLSCSIQDHFKDIGKDLYNTYQALPER